MTQYVVNIIDRKEKKIINSFITPYDESVSEAEDEQEVDENILVVYQQIEL